MFLSPDEGFNGHEGEVRNAIAMHEGTKFLVLNLLRAICFQYINDNSSLQLPILCRS